MAIERAVVYIPGLPKHLVQELNVGTVWCEIRACYSNLVYGFDENCVLIKKARRNLP